MPFSVTNTFVDGTTIEASEVNTNFDDIETVLDGGLTTYNLSATAGLTNAQLATASQEIIINMEVRGTAWTVVSTGGPIAFSGLPYDSGDGTTSTIIDADYCLFEGTDVISDGAFQIDWGYFNAGTWTQTTAVESSTNLPSTSTTASLSPASSIDTSASQQRFFAIVMATKGTSFSTADAVLTVTIKLKRELRS